LIIFQDLHMVLGENGNAVIVAELGEGDERAGFQIILCNIT
jgi:hypothetical protein